MSEGSPIKARDLFQKQISDKVIDFLFGFDDDGSYWAGLDDKSARKAFLKSIPNPKYRHIWDEWDPDDVDNAYIAAQPYSGNQFSMDIYDIGSFEWVSLVYDEDEKRGVWNLEDVVFGEDS